MSSWVHVIKNKGGFNFFVEQVSLVKRFYEVGDILKIKTMDCLEEQNYCNTIEKLMKGVGEPEKIDMFISKVLELSPKSISELVQIANSYDLRVSNSILEKILKNE